MLFTYFLSSVSCSADLLASKVVYCISKDSKWDEIRFNFIVITQVWGNKMRFCISPEEQWDTLPSSFSSSAKPGLCDLLYFRLLYLLFTVITCDLLWRFCHSIHLHVLFCNCNLQLFCFSAHRTRNEQNKVPALSKSPKVLTERQHFKQDVENNDPGNSESGKKVPVRAGVSRLPVLSKSLRLQTSADFSQSHCRWEDKPLAVSASFSSSLWIQMF